jgi:pimeloyl-ACP methyl ester carboxylesterase
MAREMPVHACDAGGSDPTAENAMSKLLAALILSLSLFLSLFLSLSCLAVGATPAATAAPVVETIAGRQVESLTLRNPASPFTVVFEAGSRGTLEKWGRVLDETSRDATVFAYHRPGYGNSSAPATPRDGRTVVEELRTLLRMKNLHPPYVLVGHSLGGLYMQLFARAHPDEVQGLVLVDALYPRTVKPVADFPWAVRLAGRLAFSRAAWQEIDRIDDTGEAVPALPAIDDKPIVRLVNQPKAKPGEVPPIPLDFGVLRQDKATIDAVRALYPNARTVIVDADHQVALATPDAVVGAIRDVLNSVGAAHAVNR